MASIPALSETSFLPARMAAAERAGEARGAAPATATAPSAGEGAGFSLPGPMTSPGGAPIARASTVSPLQQFEAFVMRSFVEAMLPKAESGFFGEGTAGEIWRSQMAEKIGEELAAGGGIGIAEMLESHEAVNGARQAVAAGESEIAAGLGARAMKGQGE